MIPRVSVERRIHYRQNNRVIVRDEGHYVFVIPVVERSLGDLKQAMRTSESDVSLETVNV